MTKTTQQVKYAVQRYNDIFNNWDTISETVTPIEAHARRLLLGKRRVQTRRKFRLVKLKTHTIITPIEAELQTSREPLVFPLRTDSGME
jgi:hypothetical protein